MKKELLVELLEIIKNYKQKKIDFIFPNINNVSEKIDKLLTLTDEEVMDILNSKDNLTVSKLYFYLNKDKISKDILPIIKKALEEESANVYYALQLLGCPNEMPKIHMVINANKIYQAEYLAKFFSDEEVLKYCDNVLELAKVILDTKEEFQAEYVCEALCDADLLISGKALEVSKKIVNMDEKFKANQTLSLLLDGDIELLPFKEKYVELISNTEYGWQAKYIRKFATYYNVENEKRLYELVKCVAKAKDKIKVDYTWEFIKMHPDLKNDLIVDIAKIMINTEKSFAPEYIYLLAQRTKFLCHNNALDFVKILDNVEEEWKAEHIYKSLFDSICLLKKDSLDIIKILEKTKNNEQAKKIRTAICCDKLIQREDAKEIIEVLVNTDYSFQATSAVLVATDKDVTKHEKALEIVKLVAGAEKIYNAGSIEEVLTEPNVLNHKNVLEIGKIVLSSKTPSQAVNSAEVATIKEVLDRDDALDIIKMFATSTKNEKNSDYAIKIMKTKAVERNDIKEIIQLVLGSKYNYQAKCAYELFDNDEFAKQERAIELVERITTTRGKRKINKLKNMILEEFQNNKNQVQDMVEDGMVIEQKGITEFEDFQSLTDVLRDSDESNISSSTIIKVKKLNENKTNSSIN